MNARAEAARVARDLRAARVPNAAFEAELLVRAASGLSRSAYFAGPEIAPEATQRLDELARRRGEREPFAYICGKREFFGLEFEVGPGVLIPRPETEILVETALAALEDMPGATVVDAGTGSGAIAVSIRRKAPHARVTGIDISSGALAVARRNAAELAPGVEFVRGDLLTGIRNADIVVANLPYIPSSVIPTLEPEVRDWEPLFALDGGADGLDLIRRLIEDCGHRVRPRLLALEVGIGQAPEVAALGEALGATPSVLDDLAGIQRVVCLRWA